MKIKKYLLKSLAFSGALILLASCASMQTAQRTFPDDVYGTTPEPQAVAETNNSADNEQYSDQDYAENYYDYYYDRYNDRLYGNRMNRFYYGTPGMSFYDPWLSGYDYYSPYYYSPFYYSPFRSSFYFGLGFGSSWYSPFNSWYSPFGYPGYGHYGYSSLGWGNPYYGSYWGPYSYYGGGYPGSVRNERTRPSRLGTDNIVRPRPSTSMARPSINNVARPTRVPTTTNGRTPSNANTRPTNTQRPTTGESTRPTQQTRPTQTRTAPVQRPAAPTVNRPTTSSPRPTNSSPAPSRSSGGSSGNTRSR
jgi:hypothetical protein